MSRYCEIETQFRDKDSLLVALCQTGAWTSDQIEYHQEKSSLIGFRNDKREEKANIIIRKQYVGKLSNDIGFSLSGNGTYIAIISKFDSKKYNNMWISELKKNYVYEKLKKDMKIRGRNVTRERLPGGRQRIKITGYR